MARTNRLTMLWISMSILLFAVMRVTMASGTGKLISDGCALCTVDPATNQRTPMRFMGRSFDSTVTQPWAAIEGPLTTQFAVDNNITIVMSHPDVENVRYIWPELARGNAFDVAMWESPVAFGEYATSLDALAAQEGWTTRMSPTLLAFHSDPDTGELEGMPDIYEFWGMWYKKSMLTDAGINITDFYDSNDPHSRVNLTSFFNMCDLVWKSHSYLSGAIGIGLGDPWAPQAHWNAIALAMGGDDWWSDVQAGQINMQTDSRMQSVWAVMSAFQQRFPQPISSTVPLHLADILFGLAPYDQSQEPSYGFIFCGSVTVTFLAAIGRDVDDYDWIPFPSIDASDIALLNVNSSDDISDREFSTQSLGTIQNGKRHYHQSVDAFKVVLQEMESKMESKGEQQNPNKKHYTPYMRQKEAQLDRNHDNYAQHAWNHANEHVNRYFVQSTEQLKEQSNIRRTNHPIKQRNGFVKQGADATLLRVGQFSTQSAYIVSTVGKNQDLALDFLRWRSKDAVALAIVSETVNGQMPPQISVRSAVALPIVARGFHMLDVTSKMHVFLDTTAPEFSDATESMVICWMLGEWTTSELMYNMEVARQQSILSQTARPALTLVDGDDLVITSGTINATIWYSYFDTMILSSTASEVATAAENSYYQYSTPIVLSPGSYRVESFAQHISMSDSDHVIELITIVDTNPTLPIYVLPSGITTSIWVISMILLGVALVLSGHLHIKRKTKVIRASSPIFCQLILFGCILVYIATALTTLEPSQAVCSSQYVLGYVGFSVVVCALFAKTWRLVRIFQQDTNIQIVRITDNDLMLYMSIFCTPTLLILIIWMSSDPPQASLMTDTLNQYVTCASSHTGWHIGILAYECSFIAIGLVFAYRVRQLPSEFNESMWILATVLNMAAMSILIITLSFSGVVTQPGALVLLDAIGLLWTTTATQGFMFVPKLLNLWFGDSTNYVTSVSHTKTNKNNNASGGSGSGSTGGNGGNGGGGVGNGNGNGGAPVVGSQSGVSMANGNVMGIKSGAVVNINVQNTSNITSKYELSHYPEMEKQGSMPQLTTASDSPKAATFTSRPTPKSQSSPLFTSASTSQPLFIDTGKNEADVVVHRHVRQQTSESIVAIHDNTDYSFKQSPPTQQQQQFLSLPSNKRHSLTSPHTNSWVEQ